MEVFTNLQPYKNSGRLRTLTFMHCKKKSADLNHNSCGKIMLRIGNVTVDSGDGAVSNQVERIIGANYSFQSAFRRAEGGD